MKKIVLASSNEHKVLEYRMLLGDYEIITLDDIGFTEDIEETGSTFLENSLIKAETISKYLKEKGLNYDVLADDSGCCVLSLNGAPGIYSARYAGNHDFKANRAKLIADLKGKDKRAYFCTTIVLYHPDGTYKPDIPVSRAEFASMAIKALGQEGSTVSQEIHFTNIIPFKFFKINRFNKKAITK